MSSNQVVPFLSPSSDLSRLRTRRASAKWALRLAVPATLLFSAATAGYAEARLNGLFSQGAVLQRGQPAPVWGTANPGEKIRVEFGDQVQETVADSGGRWQVRLGPLAASPQPRRLVVRADNTLAIEDVIVGEVWLLSGQSNMAFLMQSVARPSERDDDSPARARRDIAAANDPLLREFRVDNRPAERPRDDVATRTGWMTWNPRAAPGWAAMAFHLGRRLREQLDVPVGIVMCAWGGSGSSAWISAETLRGPGLNTLWPEDVSGWRANLAPARLYNGMLHPLAPFAIAGAGWYQGETEATPYHNPYLHRFLLTAMIADWRNLWARPELPFYIVQLPNRDNEPRWAVVRESQAEARRLPRTGMITTIDIGQSWDLHPRNKHDVAERLANLILSREYGRATWPGEAEFTHVERTGSSLRAHFKSAEHGLRTRDGKPPAALAIAGSDRMFHPAKARLDGNTVIAEHPAVPDPVAIRHAWEPSAAVNLTHAGGMPIAPFRSDDWPVDGEERMPRALEIRASLPSRFTGGELTRPDSIWLAGGDITRLGDTAPLILRGGGQSQPILVRGFPVRPGAQASPAIFWTAEPNLDARSGVTFEVKAFVTNVGNPDRGFDIEVGLRREDGSFRRHLISAFPMRLLAFENNPAPRISQATHTLLLRSALDYGAAIYRIAVRPDGIAQIYLNGSLVGTNSGEVLSGPGPTPERSYLRVGKTVATGEWSATIHGVAFDTSGAYAPAPLTKVEKEALRGVDTEP